MKKIHAALAASVAMSAVLAVSPAFAQFGMLGALAAARANTGNANATTNALAAATNNANAFSAEGLPAAAALVSPTPIAGTTGKFMSPFTSDGVTAGWVTKSMSVGAAGSVGAMAGNYAGQKAAEKATEQMAAMVPIPGMGFLAQKAGKQLGAAAGRGLALQAIGGEAFLKSSTDQSFNSLQDMAVYMYVNHSGHADYAKILAATAAIYPEFQAVYLPAVQSASLK